MPVKDAAEQLGDLAVAVEEWPGKSLAAKVRAIENYLAANDTAHACTALNDFINEVAAQTGKKISTTVAASLIARARDIRAAIGC